MNDNSFVRQRRNLIITSLLLLFALVYNFTLAELNILGNKLVMPESRPIAHFLWLPWFYFLCRYWQVFSYEQVLQVHSTEYQRLAGAEGRRRLIESAGKIG